MFERSRPLRRAATALIAALAAAQLTACNDLTAALPNIEGTYEYATASPAPRLNRRGSISITDSDPRTARFDGSYEYIDGTGRRLNGQLVGAFVQTERIWFRLLDEPQVFHEGDLVFGFGNGEIFFQGLTYETTGATFSLRLR